MSVKYYQFDYAEMNGFEVTQMGILNVECHKNISRDGLKEIARKHLQSPGANIIISNIERIDRKEFDAVKGYQI